MVTEKLYLEGQATWRKIWKERSSNKTAYLHHGCPACLLVCGHLDLTDRINFPLKALCVKACPIDYSYLTNSNVNDRYCMSNESRFMEYRKVLLDPTSKIINKRARDILKLTIWLPYEEWIGRCELIDRTKIL